MPHLLRFISIAMLIVASTVLFCGCAYVFGGALSPMNGGGVVKTVDAALPASLEKITLEHISLFPSLNNSIKFVLHAGSEPRVCVSADGNILDDLTVKVSGNVLSISGNPHRFYNTNSIKVDIYGQSYKALSLGLTSRVELATDGVLEAETLSITASGMVTGSAQIKTNDAAFTVSGSGDLLLTGSAETLKCTISGSAKIDTVSIAAKDVSVTISGSGTANMTAQKTVSCIVSGSGTLKMAGTADKLDASISGSAKVDASGIAAKGVDITISGSGSANLTTQNRVSCTVRGSGKLEMAGAADMLDVSISGSGKVDASSLVATKATLIIHGSGNANVTVLEELDITVSGSGHIKYSGTPRLTQRVSGSGKIENISK